SEEHTSELQSLAYLVCRLLLEKKKKKSDGVPQMFEQHRIVVAENLGRRPTRAGVRINCVFGTLRYHMPLSVWFCFFFNDAATTEIYPLPLHDALPISRGQSGQCQARAVAAVAKHMSSDGGNR